MYADTNAHNDKYKNILHLRLKPKHGMGEWDDTQVFDCNDSLLQKSGKYWQIPWGVLVSALVHGADQHHGQR